MAKEKKRARKDHHKSKKHQPKPKQDKPTTTESLKEHSTQSGPAAMAQTPTTMPSADTNPDQAPGVYSTGPGEVVVYNYQRQGQYADEYAAQQEQYNVAGPGQLGAASGVMNG